jgi:hypothetical protein
MKTIVGILMLVALIPVWGTLYLAAWCGIVANSLFDVLYDPIYKLAGKPFDKK